MVKTECISIVCSSVEPWYILYILIKSLSIECASALYGKMVHSLYLNKVFIN